MRNNKKLQEDMMKNIAVVGTVVLVVLLLIVSSVLFLKNKIADGNIGHEEIIGDVDQAEDFESASTEMGKTVDEAKNDIEDIQEENISKEIENAKNTQKQSEETNKESSKSKTESKVENKTENEKIQEQNNVEDKDDNKQENKQITFQAPIKGEIIREFASESLVFSDTLQEWITHKGIDIKADKTSVVASACDGIVEAIKTDPRYGITVIIKHEQGYKTVYSNLLTAEFVVQGESVSKGQTIGTVGNSASFEVADTYHLHFELLKDGEYQDPANFMDF